MNPTIDVISRVCEVLRLNHDYCTDLCPSSSYCLNQCPKLRIFFMHPTSDFEVLVDVTIIIPCMIYINSGCIASKIHAPGRKIMHLGCRVHC